VGARFSVPVQTGPGAHLASCTKDTWCFPGAERPGRDADPSPLLVPWSRKSRAIPLLSLWAVRPVQSLSACTRVTFTLYLYRSILVTHIDDDDYDDNVLPLLPLLESS
jgi:hypothetical protein